MPRWPTHGHAMNHRRYVAGATSPGTAPRVWEGGGKRQRAAAVPFRLARWSVRAPRPRVAPGGPAPPRPARRCRLAGKMAQQPGVPGPVPRRRAGTVGRGSSCPGRAWTEPAGRGRHSFRAYRRCRAPSPTPVARARRKVTESHSTVRTNSSAAAGAGRRPDKSCQCDSRWSGAPIRRARLPTGGQSAPTMSRPTPPRLTLPAGPAALNAVNVDRRRTAQAARRHAGA